MSGTTAVAFVFPGQGAQRPGMLDAFVESSGFRRLLDAAEALSGLDLARIAGEGPPDALAATQAAQPLLYLADWAWANLLEDTGITPTVVAGHSLGELAALAFAGVFSVEAGLELVCERAGLMAEAVHSAPGGMAAVLGLDRAAVVSAVADIEDVWVANDNAPGQIVLSGTAGGLESARAAVKEAGASRVLSLKVAGAFHSPLMASAGAAFAAVLERAAFSDARMPVIQNTSAEPTTSAAAIKKRVAEQIVSPVGWTETMEAMVRMGIGVAVEVGPGATLTGLARKVPGILAVAVESVGIEGVLEVVGA